MHLLQPQPGQAVDKYFDCDCDSLLVRVRPDGPACHTGNTSCFFRLLGKDAGGAL